MSISRAIFKLSSFILYLKYYEDRVPERNKTSLFDLFFRDVCLGQKALVRISVRKIIFYLIFVTLDTNLTLTKPK